MKLFQNMSRSLREDGFLRICSCSYSESSPHSPEPCSWIDQNTLTIFEKGHSRNISVNWGLAATDSVVLVGFGKDLLKRGN